MLQQTVIPPGVRSPAPVDVQLTTGQAVRVGGLGLTGQFEANVFRFLVTTRQALGLRAVPRFENQLLGGALVLTNGLYVALEVKYRLGWDTACRSNWQLEWFLRRHRRGRHPYHLGLVVFGAFRGDWAIIRNERAVGWDHWYRGHAGFHGPRIHIGLAQFTEQRLWPYPARRLG